MQQIVCEGTVIITVDGAPDCSTGWHTQVAVAPFDMSQIDPVVATAFFTAGFGLAIVPWAAAFGCAQLLKAIKRF